jgi:hypothetical protein
LRVDALIACDQHVERVALRSYQQFTVLCLFPFIGVGCRRKSGGIESGGELARYTFVQQDALYRGLSLSLSPAMAIAATASSRLRPG